jgi:hypothetical protein
MLQKRVRRLLVIEYVSSLISDSHFALRAPLSPGAINRDGAPRFGMSGCPFIS